jgi:hypothetical protein
MYRVARISVSFFKLVFPRLENPYISVLLALKRGKWLCLGYWPGLCASVNAASGDGTLKAAAKWTAGMAHIVVIKSRPLPGDRRT